MKNLILLDYSLVIDDHDVVLDQAANIACDWRGSIVLSKDENKVLIRDNSYHNHYVVSWHDVLGMVEPVDKEDADDADDEDEDDFWPGDDSEEL